MRIIIVILASICLLVATFRCANTSSYPHPGWSSDVMGKAHTVFAGIPLWIDDPQREAKIHSSRDILTYSFLVTHMWRGIPTDTVQVQANRFDIRCELGKHYLVHAGERDGSLYTTVSCVRPIESALWQRYWLPDPIFARQGMSLPRITVDCLFDSLDSADQSVRYSAAFALAHLEEYQDRTLPTFLDMVRGLRSGDIIVAMRGLGEMGPTAHECVQDLAHFLSFGDDDIRRDALFAMRCVAEPDEFFPFLIAAMRDSMSEICIHACQQAFQLEDGFSQEHRREIVEVLIDLLNDSDRNVRLTAMQTVMHFSEAGVEILLELDDIIRSDPDEQLREYARLVRRRLESEMRDRD